MSPERPVLYSFRRCPYAMRARMALSYSGICTEIREVVLRELPDELLACSPKGTVPVLVLANDRVIDESRDIMLWALAGYDPQQWLPTQERNVRQCVNQLIDENDGEFKKQLDCYKYFERYPEHPQTVYRAAGERFLLRLEQRLCESDWLASDVMTLADVAIFPFIRQFAHVDKAWFDTAPYPRLQGWLAGLLDSALFNGVMEKHAPWQPGNKPVQFPAGPGCL